MNAPRNDHYVPQFVLRNFRPSLAAKLFYAEKGSPHIGGRSPRRGFREAEIARRSDIGRHECRLVLSERAAPAALPALGDAHFGGLHAIGDSARRVST